MVTHHHGEPRAVLLDAVGQPSHDRVEVPHEIVVLDACDLAGLVVRCEVDARQVHHEHGRRRIRLVQLGDDGADRAFVGFDVGIRQGHGANTAEEVVGKRLKQVALLGKQQAIRSLVHVIARHPGAESRVVQAVVERGDLEQLTEELLVEGREEVSVVVDGERHGRNEAGLGTKQELVAGYAVATRGLPRGDAAPPRRRDGGVHADGTWVQAHVSRLIVAPEEAPKPGKLPRLQGSLEDIGAKAIHPQQEHAAAAG